VEDCRKVLECIKQHGQLDIFIDLHASFDQQNVSFQTLKCSNYVRHRVIPKLAKKLSDFFSYKESTYVARSKEPNCLRDYVGEMFGEATLAMTMTLS
jgi:hypothetical protein